MGYTMEMFLEEYRLSGSASKYMMVLVTINGGLPEVIINTARNFEKKMNYYQCAYSDDLTLKSNNNIRIVGFAFFNDLDYLKSVILDV